MNEVIWTHVPQIIAVTDWWIYWVAASVSYAGVDTQRRVNKHDVITTQTTRKD